MAGCQLGLNAIRSMIRDVHVLEDIAVHAMGRINALPVPKLRNVFHGPLHPYPSIEDASKD